MRNCPLSKWSDRSVSTTWKCEYLRVQFRPISFTSLPQCGLNFSLLVSQHTTVASMEQLVADRLCIQQSRVALFRTSQKNRDSCLLSKDISLADLLASQVPQKAPADSDATSVSSMDNPQERIPGPMSNPPTATIYYEFDCGDYNSPILSTDYYFLRKSRAPTLKHKVSTIYNSQMSQSQLLL